MRNGGGCAGVRRRSWFAPFLAGGVALTTATVKDIREIHRRASPAPKPQSLVWDGTQFWTNHREQNEIVAFARVE